MDTTNQKEFAWTFPEYNAILEAIEYFWHRSRKTPIRTIEFKLHKISAYKRRVLLETHAFVTNLVHAIVQRYHEDPFHPRNDGVLAAIAMIQNKRSDGKVTARALSEGFARDIKPYLESQNAAIASSILHGAYRDCAEMLLSWFSLLKQHPSFDDQTSLEMEDFYRSWQQAEQRYRRSMETVVALSLSVEELEREKDHRLERRSKREARWILARILPQEQLVMLQNMVKALLDDEPSTLQRQAAFVEHPWRFGKKHHRRVREQWFFVRNITTMQTRQILGELDRNEQEMLNQELEELFAYFDHVEAIMMNIYGDDQELLQTTASLPTPQKLKAVISDFLYRKPRSFPHRQQVYVKQDGNSVHVYPVSEEHTASLPVDTDREALYQRRLQWFQLYNGQGDILKRFLSSKQEAEEVQGLYQALRMLKSPKLFPIRFNGTMRPKHSTDGEKHDAQFRYFAMLYDPGTYKLTLAVMLHLVHVELMTPQEQAAQRKLIEQNATYTHRRADNPMYYSNPKPLVKNLCRGRRLPPPVAHRVRHKKRANHFRIAIC